MKLAFYYHIPLAKKNGQLYLPGYIGVFVEELAQNVDELFVIMHEAQGVQIDEADYQLVGDNIRFVNLEVKTASWKRSLNPGKILKTKIQEIENCNAFLVRSPSPLAPYFHRYLKSPKLFYLVVGDYAEGAKQIGKKGLKNKLLYAYFHHNDKKFRERLPETDIFVNSPELFDKYKSITKSIELVKTTTLREDDFYQKPSIDLQDPIRLLYTGRIEPAKGMIELLEAASRLIEAGKKIQIDIVGWEVNTEKPFENKLKKQAETLGIIDSITFHGKKKLGPELNQYYRDADIYVLPSYHEGFPRTIWEAMANKLPVVTTSVGAIPFYLKNEETAYIVQSKNVDELTGALKKCIEDYGLRAEIIKNGFKLAKESSLTIQTTKIINYIREKI